MTSHRRTALAVMAAGFAFSLAANVLWTWPGGPVRVIGGLFASVALPAAVHLWPAVPAHTWPRRGMRLLAVGGIAVMAAWTTFAHASNLLVAHGEAPLLAAMYPACTELLVVLGVLAYRAPAPVEARPRQTARGGGRPAGRDEGKRAGAGSGADRWVSPSSPPPSRLVSVATDSPHEWAAAHFPCRPAQVQAATGCSRSTAFRAVKAAREAADVAA